jgi:hypothetical protein
MNIFYYDYDDNCILSNQQSNYLYKMSYVSLFSVFASLFLKNIYISLVPSSVLLSSIYYWKKPDYSIRRYIDMVTVKLSLTYYFYIAHKYNIYSYIFFMLLLPINSYFVGLYYYNKDNWKSTFFHSGTHILGNIGNIYLYYHLCRLNLSENNT